MGASLRCRSSGAGPHVPEFVARRDHEGVCVHLHQPALDSAIDDEAAWHEGNPSLRCGLRAYLICALR